MKVGDLSIVELEQRLRGAGAVLSIGPVIFRARSRLPGMAPVLHRMYAAYNMDPDAIVDFDVSVNAAGHSRMFGSPLANFRIDGNTIRDPFPRQLAWPFLEWAANYAFGTRSHHFLLVHAAVVERPGGAMALPGRPGAGKSTLTASLVARGWRFLSDEFLIIDPVSGLLLPFPRPISLKSASIDIVRKRAPHAIFSPIFEGTHKGDVAYMAVPDLSVAAASQPATLRWVIFPRYEAGAGLQFEPKSKARAFLEMADNSFNYQVRRERGFDDLRRAFGPVSCFDLRYDDLDAAIGALESLT